MYGWIEVETLHVSCVIGTHPHERIHAQVVMIDIAVLADFSACTLTDSIQDTIDYTRLAERCAEVAHTGAFHLLETLAVRIGEMLVREFPISRLKLRVKKPGVLPNTEAVAVMIQGDARNFARTPT